MKIEKGSTIVTVTAGRWDGAAGVIVARAGDLVTVRLDNGEHVTVDLAVVVEHGSSSEDIPRTRGS